MNAPINVLEQKLRLNLQRWRPQIERALQAADLMTYADIERDVLEVRKLFFDNGAAFAVVEIIDYPKGRVCHILIAGGSLQGLKELQDLTIPFFKLIGARRLTQAGRFGWERVLPAWGWKTAHSLMELPIDEPSDPHLYRRDEPAG